MTALLLLLSCAEEPAPSPAPPSADTADTATAEPASVTEPLGAPRLLRRLSLDLRGVLPAAEELDAVAADPGAVWGYRDAWLSDPALEERLVHLLAERWHTRVDGYLIFYLEYQELAFDPLNEYPFERSVGEEPLRLMAHVIAEDLPWSTVVTADFTVANEILGMIWPIDRPEGADGWVVSEYTDARPAAGVLSTNGLWWRYFSTPTNYNRGRVAALTRLLVCEDYTARSISFSEVASLSTGADTEDALRASPYCQGCHASIDPIAAALFGFWPANEYSIYEVDRYHPERESLGAELMGVEPEWFGDPVYGLNELGAHIAADPRFQRCAVESMASALWRREIDPLADHVRLGTLEAAYVDGGDRIKPLMAAITETPEYQAGGLTDAATEEDAAREATVRLMTPAQLSSALEALSGYSLERLGFDQMDNDTLGFRVLAGGVDGEYVTRPQEAPNLTQHLTVQRLSEAVAAEIVEADLGSGGGLLGLVDAETTPNDAAFAAQLDALRWRLCALPADDAWRSDVTELWALVALEDGAAAAWQAVLSAMMQDTDFVGY